MDESPTTPSRDDYHRAILAELGIKNVPSAILDDLDCPLDVPHLEPFLDVRCVLEELRARDPHGDRHRQLGKRQHGEAKHDRIGLQGFFEAFVVSSELGCNKPDPRMYRTASDALGLEAGECFYVDDDPALVGAAVALGYRGAAICRSRPPFAADVDVMSGLEELLQLIARP